MTNVGGIVLEDIGKTLKAGHGVFDKDGKKVGQVDQVEERTGYFRVLVPPLPKDKDNPFENKALYVPFSLITNIDPREVYVSVSRDELRRDYANPPPRFTAVVDEGGSTIAATTEPSGFTGLPIIVDRVRIDQLREHIAAGYHVYTSEMTDLGKIKEYDPMTGWMLVEKGVLSDKHNLMVPVTIVRDVAPTMKEVYLVTSEADLQRLQHLEPAYVVFVDAKVRTGG